MQNGWLAKAGAIRCDHIRCPDYAGPIAHTTHARGVLHTTEGHHIEDALAVFRQHYAPHFVVGYDRRGRLRVVQLLPLGSASSSLEHPAGTVPTNGVVRAQIELVGFSQHRVWAPARPLLVALAGLMRELADPAVTGIPLRHVHNPGRDQRIWERNGGWFGHCDVPNNHHWDPGRINWEALFAAAGGVKHPVKVRPKPHRVVPLSPVWRLVRRANGLVYTEPLDRPH